MATKRTMSDKLATSACTNRSDTPKLSEYLSRKIITWNSASTVHIHREQALVDIFIDTGYPITLIDTVSFQKLCATMDAKFQLPGIYFVPCTTKILTILHEFGDFFVINSHNQYSGLTKTKSDNGNFV